MKKFPVMFSNRLMKSSVLALSLALLSGCGWFHHRAKTEPAPSPQAAAPAPTPTPAPTPAPAPEPAAAPTPTAAAAPTAITDDEIRSAVARVAKHQIKSLADGDYPDVTDVEAVKNAKPPQGISWGYPWGVYLYGAARSVDVTGDKDVDNFVLQHDLIVARYYKWLASVKAAGNSEFSSVIKSNRIRGLMNLGNLDSCGAMGNQFLESMLRHPDQVTPEEKAVVERIADWVANKQERLPDGTLWRPSNAGDSSSGMSKGTVWPDDLYMGGVFLTRWGIYNHDAKFIDDAATNIINQAKLTQDEDGLWFHGYSVTDNKRALYKWGRGDGWVTVTLVETLSAMDENDPLRPQLLDILRKQIEGLKKVQAPDGMWHQVLDHPEVWEETSCTAMFAYGIARAVNKGWIDASNMEVARRAFAGIAKKVSADGAVLDTCHGTNIGGTLEFYVNRPHDGDDPHGWGPVLLAGTEILAGAKK